MPLGDEHIPFSESHFTQDKPKGYCQGNFKAFPHPSHAHTPVPHILSPNQL